MLELTYSNHTESLLRHLAERLRREREEGKGPWEPSHLVVPNPCLKEYVRLGLARELGVAANLQFTYLDGLWKGILNDESGRILDADMLRAGLLAALGDRACLAHPDLAPVRSYLEGDRQGLKRVQLAGELARIFEEYQLSRPDWIQAWRAGRSAGIQDGTWEVWQAQLWREAVRHLDGGGGQGPGGAHLTMLERIQVSGFQGLSLPRAIHAFGLGHVAQAYRDVYRAFAPLENTTLHLYALNPCGEFWEDLNLDRSALWTHRPSRQETRRGPWDGTDEDPYGLVTEGPQALRLWGRPGRENIRLLNEVSDCDFIPAFHVPKGETLLARIQRGVLFFQDPTGPGAARPDDSIRFLACPSPRRESEIVATEIWRLMEIHRAAGDPLGFSDIAVVVPPGSQEAYRTHLQAAFLEAHHIPMVQSDRALPVMRQTLEAVALLLELPTSGMTRAALLRVLQHPSFQRSVPGGDPEAWSRWCASLGIIRGADRKDWDGTYLDQEALSWDQGLRRLALGAFMAEGAEFTLGDGRYPVPDLREGGQAATFIALVRGLCADARELGSLEATPVQWMSRLRAYLDRWLQVEEGEEAEAVARALDRIQTFLIRPFVRIPSDLDMGSMGFHPARHLALEALGRLQDEQPASLSKGVVVATYASVRAIPFRALFLMGLGEGSFPTRDTRSALDLRSQKRRPGDVSHVEQEKYLFLELLLSARDHLVLSYVAMDELSGEPYEPSGLWKEFRNVLDGYVDPQGEAEGGEDPFLEVHPLRRYDGAYFPEWSGAPAPMPPLRSWSETAEAEARALWLGAQARAHGVVPPRALGDLDLAPEALARLREALVSPDLSARIPEVDPLPLALGDLRMFLECPLSGGAAVRLGLRNRSLEDPDAVEDELFETSPLEAWSLPRETVLEAWRQGVSVREVYAGNLRSLQSRGRAPFGIFSQVEARRHLASIEAWATYLQARSQGRKPVLWRLGMDRPGRRAADHSLPPLALELDLGGRVRRVELFGELRPQAEGSLFLEGGTPPSPSEREGLRRKALAAYLDHLVLACVDPSHGAHRARFVYETSKTFRGAREPVQELAFDFPALSRGEAEERLKAWIGDLLTGDHGVLMPIEAVLRVWGRKPLTPESILDYVDDQVEQGQTFRTLLGPVPDPTSYPPPSDPQALAERRLGDFLAAVCGDPASEEA